MPDTIRCSECGNTYAQRGFGSHNAAIHNGEATAKPVDTSPEPETETETMSDKSNTETESADAESEPSGGEDLPDPVEQGRAKYREAFESEDTEVDGDPDAGQVSDEVEDTEEDARDYNCGNCGHGLEYLGGEDRDGGGKACPECGERLFWSRVEA